LHHLYLLYLRARFAVIKAATASTAASVITSPSSNPFVGERCAETALGTD